MQRRWNSWNPKLQNFSRKHWEALEPLWVRGGAGHKLLERYQVKKQRANSIFHFSKESWGKNLDIQNEWICFFHNIYIIYIHLHRENPVARATEMESLHRVSLQPLKGGKGRYGKYGKLGGNVTGGNDENMMKRRLWFPVTLWQTGKLPVDRYGWLYWKQKLHWESLWLSCLVETPSFISVNEMFLPCPSSMRGDPVT